MGHQSCAEEASTLYAGVQTTLRWTWHSVLHLTITNYQAV